MRRFLQRLLYKPVSRLADKYSSRPNKARVNKALNALHKSIITKPGKKGLVIPFDNATDKFIILSDQHKGARDGADIFAKSAKNYLAALAHYNLEKFIYINLGDSEELWENLFITVKRHNKATFEKEKLFLEEDRFVKIFGNHDLYWGNDPLAAVSLMQIYGKAIKVYEGAILQTTVNGKPLEVFLTHGHQGDLQSDGNWFSKWFVSEVWGKLQGYLRINPNTPAYNNQLKTDHNRIMYEWSSKRKNLVLITGHTHQPVFRSMTQLENLYNSLEIAKKQNKLEKIKDFEKKITDLHLKGNAQPNFNGYLDTYFNSGCCCFNDGDITGIEIENGCIRLIKWSYLKKVSVRTVLEESKLEDLRLE
ncbi:metallophosphoesterase [Mucilaginibacter glaciei]|uniref:Metallophosphoesterase family protein n=1 Tax=Mucilaginibacter glaciei TaxID=2772109 RepID=A0A926S102_9SPHI|nr:metallophosphoesterase [Mucilaginibacter glaciei]MBD1393505.1 metallophosphoesterase family protein [Mucilaginibacter glaciei]